MRKLFSLLMSVALLSTLVGCASDQAVIQQAADAHAEIDPAVVTDPELQRYVQTIGDRMVEQARQMSAEEIGPKAHFSEDNAWMFGGDVRFHLVNSNTLNAFTTGGQHVYLYTGLFVQSKTEDEFAAVVAHEFAHIYARHVHNGMNRQYMSLAAAAAAAGAGALVAGEDARLEGAAAGAAVGFVGAQFWGMGYSRKDENEADKYGFKMYTRAGYDPDRFGDFFQQMIDKGFDKGPEFASSHPRLADRVEASQRRARELRQENPDYRQWRRPNVARNEREFRRLQQRALSVAKSMPRDETLEAAQLMLAAFPSCVAPEPQPSQIEAREELLQAIEGQE